MKFTLILAAFVAASSAHMRMSDPPPIHALGNKFGKGEDQREPLMGPEQFPCRGYGSSLGSGAGQTVAQWEAGSMQKFKTFGAPAPSFQASHGGGSCQVSFSTDLGKTFKVVKSFIGGCPSLPDDGNIGNGEAHGTHIVNGYPFKVPKDLPIGPVLFAWTWFNNIGNREMYMNCAAIEITGKTGEDSTMKFEDRPDTFVANLPPTEGECRVPAGSVNFPQPGPDVVVLKDATLEKHLIVEPTGNCGEIKRDVKGVFMDATQYLEMGKVDLTGSAPGGDSTPGTVNELPADAPNENRKAENKLATPVDSFAAYSSPAAATKSSAVAPLAPVSEPSSVAPATPAAPVSGSTSGSTGGTAKAKACPASEEGNWNCIDGKSASRCASGAWSAIIQMAEGTGCETGIGKNLNYVPIAAPGYEKRTVRISQPHVRRHAARHRS